MKDVTKIPANMEVNASK